MIRVFGLILLSVALVAGCGDSSKPVRREAAVAPPEADPHGSMPSNPHGTMPPNPHGAMGAMGGVAQAQLDSPIVRLGSMALTAPEGWIRLQPSSGFTLAEFQLPRAEGDDADGRLTITAVGGSVEANFDRWRQQFNGKPDQETREQIEVAGIEFSTISLQGTFNAAHGGMGQTEQVPNYQMLAAIFDVQGRQCIVKGYGPQHTMAKHAESYNAFLRSLDWAKPAGQPGSGHPPVPPPQPKPEPTVKPKEAEQTEKPAEAKEPAKPAEVSPAEKPAEADQPAKPEEAKPEEAKQAEEPEEAKESAEPTKGEQ